MGSNKIITWLLIIISKFKRIFAVFVQLLICVLMGLTAVLLIVLIAIFFPASAYIIQDFNDGNLSWFNNGIIILIRVLVYFLVPLIIIFPICFGINKLRNFIFKSEYTFNFKDNIFDIYNRFYIGLLVIEFVYCFLNLDKYFDLVIFSLLDTVITFASIIIFAFLKNKLPKIIEK